MVHRCPSGLLTARPRQQHRHPMNTSRPLALSRAVQKYSDQSIEEQCHNFRHEAFSPACRQTDVVHTSMSHTTFVFKATPYASRRYLVVHTQSLCCGCPSHTPCAQDVTHANPHCIFGFAHMHTPGTVNTTLVSSHDHSKHSHTTTPAHAMHHKMQCPLQPKRRVDTHTHTHTQISNTQPKTHAEDGSVPTTATCIKYFTTCVGSEGNHTLRDRSTHKEPSHDANSITTHLATHSHIHASMDAQIHQHQLHYETHTRTHVPTLTGTRPNTHLHSPSTCMHIAKAKQTHRLV